jgi:hypothetical protein
MVLPAAIAILFAAFAATNVQGFANRTQDYLRFVTEIRRMHGYVPSHTTGLVGPPTIDPHGYAFLNAAVQWDYRDPTIHLAPDTTPK